MFKLPDFLPEDLAQTFAGGWAHRGVIVTYMSLEWSDGRARGDAEMLPDHL